MIYFNSDYTEGCHPKILEELTRTNMMQTPGYGMDEFSEKARNLIKVYCQNENIDIHFLIGGTATNVTAISHSLRPYQAVISAETGHINVHETGAVEQKGHKILSVPTKNGKLSVLDITKIVDAHLKDPHAEHTAMPKMVYLSQPTELGTLYTRKELEDISKICKNYGLYLFIDGARLGYALSSSQCDINLADITDLADLFYIGGTKCGALFGEALVIVHDELKQHFRYSLKQNGQMLAKGRLLGIQFQTLFTDNLYFEMCEKANLFAEQIRQSLMKKNIEFFIDSPTNQLFPILPNSFLDEIKEDFHFEPWSSSKEWSTVRICTSYATTEENVSHLIQTIEADCYRRQR